jgi:3-deoxy-manno-octulosonate cytidylyltransferase (CMP-KDO synthetase)
MKIFGIIPARFNSTRFPGKPLVIIQEKPMIQHVYERTSKCSLLEKVIVATDDKRIFKTVKNFNGEVILTSDKHQSGTDRCGEVAGYLVNSGMADKNDILVNIQGDEPFIDPKQIELTISLFDRKNVCIATLARQIKNKSDIFNPNVVKVVFGSQGNALYFSRQCIPFLISLEKENWPETGVFYEHIGIYAFRINILNELIKLPVGLLEQNEKLEQLRWLENNYPIHVNITSLETYSIDIPDDLKKIKQFLD